MRGVAFASRGRTNKASVMAGSVSCVLQVKNGASDTWIWPGTPPMPLPMSDLCSQHQERVHGVGQALETIVARQHSLECCCKQDQLCAYEVCVLLRALATIVCGTSSKMRSFH
eukprot:1161868-Pelagomonas_calceolata.AAC.15